MSQTPAACQLTGIRTKTNGEHGQSKVGDEQEPPPATSPMRRTVDRCHQVTLDQVRHVCTKSRAARSNRQRQQVRHGGQWQLSDQL
jgi:hypothetical protein